MEGLLSFGYHGNHGDILVSMAAIRILKTGFGSYGNPVDKSIIMVNITVTKVLWLPSWKHVLQP